MVIMFLKNYNIKILKVILYLFLINCWFIWNVLINFLKNIFDLLKFIWNLYYKVINRKLCIINKIKNLLLK